MPLTLKFQEPLATVEVVRPMAWRGCSAEHVVIDGDEPFSFAVCGSSHYLALHDIRLADGEIRVDGQAPNHGHDLSDTITYLPVGCPVSGWSAPEARRNSFLALNFEPELLSEELERRYRVNAPGPLLYARDPVLLSTLHKLKSIVAFGRPDPLHAESLCLLAALEVFSIVSDPVGGRLSERQLRQVRAYVEAHLHLPIGLSELAAAAGLSRYHFSRAFKASTGLSPYRYLTEQRVAAARIQLRCTSDTIDAIAAQLGFGGAAQFRRAFTAIVGCSPSIFRRQG